MTEEEIRKLVDGNSDVLIKEMGRLGIDFKDLSKDIAKDLVRKAYNLTDDQFDAVDFIFWVSYFIEKTAEDLIIGPEVLEFGAREKTMKTLVDKLHLTDKIKVLSELHTSNNDPLISIMYKIKDFRNDIAHGRFDSLSYAGYHLSDNRGKLRLVADIRDALKRK